MAKVSRRTWIAAGAAAAFGLPAGALWLDGRDAAATVSRFGALRRDPRGVLDLLEGFRYVIVDRAGRPMNDGYPVPPRPDGMACFSSDDGALVLMRNHELPRGVAVTRAIGRPWTADAYDRDSPGAVTRLVLDPETLAVRTSNMVLGGTSMNCSGGACPAGWLSCEEDPDDRRHGYVFLCDPAASALAPPFRVTSYGRFRHEAAAFESATGRCYLTEDRPDGCLYRFVPADPAEPFGIGTLFAMKIRGRARFDTGPLRTGAGHDIEWVPLDDADPAEDDLRATAQRLGAARVVRGEGIHLGHGRVYVCATAGGPIGCGQIFAIEDDGDRGTLRVIASSEDRAQMDMPDNVTMDPRGVLWFVEDGEGHDYLRGVAPDGEVFAVGRNALSEGELTGVCFTPDGRAMFVNLQEEGLTLRVEGPFERFASA
ncbi:MAG: alkaline phosphatase PhoX [Sandaracinaceae bacterium]